MNNAEDDPKPCDNSWHIGHRDSHIVPHKEVCRRPNPDEKERDMLQIGRRLHPYAEVAHGAEVHLPKSLRHATLLVLDASSNFDQIGIAIALNLLVDIE